MQKFATWQDIFKNINSSYERVWSKEEEEQNTRFQYNKLATPVYRADEETVNLTVYCRKLVCSR